MIQKWLINILATVLVALFITHFALIAFRYSKWWELQSLDKPQEVDQELNEQIRKHYHLED